MPNDPDLARISPLLPGQQLEHVFFAVVQVVLLVGTLLIAAQVVATV